MTQPSYFIPHGGGPCFFMDWDPPQTWDAMRGFLETLVSGQAEKPKAVLVATAHWETPVVTVSSKLAPDLYYDYNNFPPHTYQLDWPAKGDPALAARVAALVQTAGLEVALDDQRDYDHGVFVPMKVAMPAPDIPVVAMSIRQDLDPAHHLAVGRALRPLRDEGVLIIGSGLSYHNLGVMLGRGDAAPSWQFDRWLTDAITGDPAQRAAALADWQAAPGARASHPREEHLAPVWVAAGAGGDDPASRVYHEDLMGAAVSAFRFGAAS